MATEEIEQAASSPIERKQLVTPQPELAESAISDMSRTERVTSTSIEKPQEFGSTPGKEESHPLTDKSTNKAKEQDKASQTEDVPIEKKDAKDKKVKDDSDEDKKEDAKKDKDDGKSDHTDKKGKDEENEKKTALPRGMKTDVKQLWAKTDAQCKCCTTWVEDNPDDGKNIEESDECLQHAIVVRKKKKHEGNRKPLKVDSIVVHSPLIKRVLQNVFSGYPDLVIDLDELIFDAPFAAFFHRWADFERAVEDEADTLTKSHLKLLYDVLQAELQKPIQRHKDLVRHKAIDFELLWTLFTPGTLMYSHDQGHDRLYQTSDCEYWSDLSGMKFTVRCETIDWDGEKFGKTTLAENIAKFRGTKQITTLPSYPLQYHTKADEMKKKCIDRGRRFQELAGTFCRDYKGTAIEYTKYSIQTATSKRHLEGRIMLDEELFSKFNPEQAVDLCELDEDDEDVKKAEVESAERLADHAKKATEALKKAEAEGQKKKAEKEEKGKEEDEATKKAKKKTEDDAAIKDVKNDANSDDTTSLMNEESTKDEKSTEIKTENTAQEAGYADDGKLATEAVPSDEVTANIATDDKKDSISSASTDSEGTPTPAESEDSVEEPGTFSQTEKQELKEQHLAICTSWLRGYSLSQQKWCSFSVAHITDVSWNDDAFEQLTLPAEYRELILATIQSQIRQNQWKQKMEKADKEQKPIASFSKQEGKDAEGDGNPAEFDDFIAQKGLGYIMLFSGNPGVGKTATAESIAELLHVPLCIISVGNLGTSAESVESALQDILELASKWSAVLLLDEADIFLEQRSKHDLHRNAVVSVFLRLLEYYQGVLCLTTNRAQDIDEAFHSRIHISLPFPDLTENNREQIWRHFAKITSKKHELNAAKRKAIPEKVSQAEAPGALLTDAEKTENGTKTPVSEIRDLVQDKHHDPSNNLIELSTSDYRKLSQTQLNGRQIKNAFKTAVLLASYKKENVQMKHVKIALKTIDGGLGKTQPHGMYY